jgi:SAM-dependent methyltransferase
MNDLLFDLTEGWNSLSADLLYAYTENGAPAAELEFYENRIRANGGYALDQACGTGRHIFPLLERGLQVHGADISAEALAFARITADAKHSKTRFYQQRMEDCDLPIKYGTIYIANGTFQIIVDRAKAFQTLNRFFQQLAPRGQLLVELSVPTQSIKDPAANDEAHPIRWEPTPRRGAKGQIQTALWTDSVDPFEQTLVSKRRNELIVDGQVIRSELCSHPMRWYYKYEFLMMLDSAGFVDLQTYSNYTEESATKSSTTVIYAGRRAPS